VGSEDSNQRLSERRADSVKSYLTAQGIGALRLSAVGARTALWQTTTPPPAGSRIVASK
jgi:hypothetical protein